VGSVIGRLEWRATSFKALSMSGASTISPWRGLRQLPDSRSSSHFAFASAPDDFRLFVPLQLPLSQGSL
jgi:hypothetical protein